jgi:hypothetical protein
MTVSYACWTLFTGMPQLLHTNGIMVAVPPSLPSSVAHMLRYKRSKSIVLPPPLALLVPAPLEEPLEFPDKQSDMVEQLCQAGEFWASEGTWNQLHTVVEHP